ncbi:MAG: LacI family DNA-binding transcriptional regulator [Isosphaeraceae bacterium]|nr:LacI family DNA-binding transcriptional regulator [Isosphaeraceae bacterium]
MTSPALPKYQDLSHLIETEITSGRWREGRMPGLRELAAEYGVSVVTASRAVRVLREKGLVQSVHRSGNFIVAEADRGIADVGDGRTWAVCFRTTPGPWQRASSSVTMAGFETVAAHRGFLLDPFTFAIDDTTSRDAIGGQVRRALEQGVAGVFLLPSRISDVSLQRDEWLLESCKAAELPAVLIERNLRGDDRRLEWDLVGTDDLRGGFECTRHLLDGGRRRIAFVHAGPTSGHNERLAGYLLALCKAGGADDPGRYPPLVLEHRLDVANKQAFGRLAERLLELSADSVFCYQDTVAMGLILELLARRVRIPEDVAFVGYDDLPIGNSFSLGLTTYQLDSERVAEEAFRVMEQRVLEPGSAPIKVAVPGRLIVRESSSSVA